jgi:hypothetical protein
MQALTGHILWILRKGNSLWDIVMQSKYFSSFSIEEWFRQQRKSSMGFIVWKSFVFSFPLVGYWNAWKIGNCRRVFLREYPWLGVGNNFCLSDPLIQSIRVKNIFMLSHTKA